MNSAASSSNIETKWTPKGQGNSSGSFLLALTELPGAALGGSIESGPFPGAAIAGSVSEATPVVRPAASLRGRSRPRR